MDVLGFSGLHNSQAFKRREYRNLDIKFNRICQGFDSAAAVVTGSGLVAAAAEERFVRVKATGEFPVNAITYCLDAAGIPINELECIAHGFDYKPFEELYGQDDFTRRQYEQVYSLDNQLEQLDKYFPQVKNWDQKLVAVPHHVAHAASAFYPSGYDEALILVADGMGEQFGLTVAIGSGSEITILKQIPAINSLGILYSVFTMYLGFEFNMDEYKVMGLAPYGDARRYFDKVMDLINLHDDGTHTIPLLFKNETSLDRETYAGSIAMLTDIFGPPREPKTEITRNHQDIAAALQMALQTTVLHLLRAFQHLTGATNLASAGGVALNCTLNGVLKRSRMFNNCFVQPAAGDDGSALGAALYARKLRGDGCRDVKKMGMPFLGPDIKEHRIRGALANTNLQSTHYPDESALLNTVAEHITSGQIIGWCQGRMEFGPRALGGRSIIADPGNAEMRDKINSLVKKREDFRPFAPAVASEAASRYFEIEGSDTSLFEYMLCVAPVRKEYRDKLPAITHVDGSARVQTVSRENNGRLWRLLQAIEKRNGTPMVLNTSFNVMGQPVVCSEQEAVDTFVEAGLDALVIGDFIVTKLDVNP